MAGSIALVLMDGRQPTLAGWLAYAVVLGLCAALTWLAWRGLAPLNPPNWLSLAMLMAFVARLGLAVAFTHLLPAYGSGRDHQLAGYFYPDAYDRDRIAWEFGRSDRPLWDLSPREQRADQYGGLLLWSAAGYRVLSPDAHRPLLVTLQAAWASAITVLFTWGFVTLAFGAAAATFAAWLMALYPESVLLGASQMREPFLGLGLALMLFGYSRLRRGETRKGAAPLAVGALLSLFLSPPSLVTAAALLGLAWLWERRARLRLPVWGIGLILLGAALAIVLTIRAWAGAGVWAASPLGVLWAWVTRTGQYELYVLERGSGMVQALFRQTPAWAHAPLATAYGLVRPLLPAALFEPGLPLAQSVEVLRSVGWTFLLPFLIYAPLAAPRAAGWRSLAMALAWVVWLTAILASFRGGADGWDNVRYRAAYLVIQAAVAGWAWAEARRRRDPWLARVGWMVLGVVIAFGQWYASRYLGTPGLSLAATLAAAVGAVLILALAFVVLDWRRRRRLTGPPPGV